MKLKCDGYTPQSNICNSSFRGKCPLALIEAKEGLRCEVRCPRRPWIDSRRGVNKEYYVKHVEIID